ncbi:hypothetical protein ACQP1P_10060 [Dactylosporangium sp. CA-052675]|uniref:hypothetical protein n=1 Tax=Dactylosporangium sp. CA-052675 TaxID=3239927 RepID=UPI003D8AE496
MTDSKPDARADHVNRNARTNADENGVGPCALKQPRERDHVDERHHDHERE